MHPQTLKHSVITGLFWKLMERGGSQLVSFVIQIILARILMPAEYGVMALLNVLIVFSTTLVDAGFGSALIQKKNADTLDYASVFSINLLISALLYLLLFFFAPAIAAFYRLEQLVLLIRVYSLTLFSGAFYSVQVAILSRDLKFKQLFIGNFTGTLVSGVIGIVSAFLGLGIWALVLQQAVRSVWQAIVLTIIADWKPRFRLYQDRLKTLFAYGWKLMVNGLLFGFQNEIRNLLIGKYYTSEALGYYNRGNQFPDIIISNVNGAIQAVMFPAFSSQQQDPLKVRQMMRRSIITSSYIMFPMLISLAAVAEPLTLLLLTEKWLKSVPFMQVMAFTALLMPLQTTNLQAITAMGRSDITLTLGIIKLILNIIVLLITLPLGVMAVALGGLVISIIGSLLNAWPNKKLLGYSYAEQLSDVLPIFLVALVSGVVVYLMGYMEMPAFLLLALQILAGGGVYYLLSLLFIKEGINYLQSVVKSLYLRRE